MEKYIFYIIIIILIILIISIYFSLKKKESFSNSSSYSQYSKEKIIDNCVNSWAKIYNPQGSHIKACETQAWITDPKFLCGICGNSDKNPLYSFQANDVTKLYGCAANTPNKIGLNWLQGDPVYPLNLRLSDQLTCNYQDINAVCDMYLYVCADDHCNISLNGKKIITTRGWSILGVYHLRNIKYGDELSFNLVNVCGPGGINVSYIWNKKLFIMNKNGYENCANIIKYTATGTTQWDNGSTTVWGSVKSFPWMKNWLRCADVNCDGTKQSSVTLTFKVGDFANQDTLNNDLVGFLGIDDYGSVYYKNTLVFNKPSPWSNVMQFTIPNVEFMDNLDIQCTNTGGPGSICLSYLWCGELFTIPNNLQNFNKVANIITYTGPNFDDTPYSPNGASGNLPFVTNWINATDTNFTFSILAGFNPWIYQPSNGKWYTIVKNNKIGIWNDLPLISNTKLTISFWLNLRGTNSNWRNIFHFSNNDVDCCDIGNRVPGLWVCPDSSILCLANDLEDRGNAVYINPYDIPLNFPVFIAFTWNGNVVKCYVNSVLQQTATYPQNIEPVVQNATFYIGDPWYPADDGVLICNFEICGFPLPQADITNIYNKQLGSLPPVPAPPHKNKKSWIKRKL